MINKIQLSLFYLLCCLTITTRAQQNTLLIIADDVSPDYFSFFSTSTDTANTPQLKALANKGVKYTKAWSTPVCSPTRAAIFTGRYPFRTGVGGVITNASSPQLDTAEISIAKLLKYSAPVKYNTACVGKWHLHNNQPAKRLYPNKLGYDYYSGNFNGAITDYYNYAIVRNGILDTVTTYATTQTVNDAISWMDTMNTNKPFFLWLAFNAPHDPYHLPPATLCNVNGLTGTTAHINANKAKYFKASIEAMDTEIGRLLNYLNSKNLLDSTNIIFIGDNGNSAQVAQISNTLKSKGTIYDYGVRVPLFISGPAVKNGGRSSSELVSTVDLYATILELSGFGNWSSIIPSSTKIDSKSFLPSIANQGSNARTWIFSETFNNPADADDGKTIRNNDYHLLRFDNGIEEFYNQSLDGEENNNLLLNTSSMSSSDISNYHFLCDTMSALIGTGTCLPLSLEEVKPDYITIYPNPAQGNIIINSSINTEFIMYNSLGITIYKDNVNMGNNTISTSGFAKGIYYFLFTNNGSRLLKKIIIE